MLESQMQGVPEDERSKMVAGNAVSFFASTINRTRQTRGQDKLLSQVDLLRDTMVSGIDLFF
jgi:hypothetical protein